MDIIFETLFELILEGSIGAMGNKKVPLPIRIIAAVFLFLLFGALIGGLLYLGISEGNWIMIVIAIVIVLLLGFTIWHTYRKRH